MKTSLSCSRLLGEHDPLQHLLVSLIVSFFIHILSFYIGLEFFCQRNQFPLSYAICVVQGYTEQFLFSYNYTCSLTLCQQLDVVLNQSVVGSKIVIADYSSYIYFLISFSFNFLFILYALIRSIHIFPEVLLCFLLQVSIHSYFSRLVILFTSGACFYMLFNVFSSLYYQIYVYILYFVLYESVVVSFHDSSLHFIADIDLFL